MEKGILYRLFQGTLHFSEIRKRLLDSIQRMLNTQLRELQPNGFVLRTVSFEVRLKLAL